MMNVSRREFLETSAAVAGVTTLGTTPPQEAIPGDRPPRAEGISVLNPRARVPLSFIIDDSTCLMNAAYFKIPQFAEVYPDRYKQNWRMLPREIPDEFVLKFYEWCHERGVRGKYSVIPYPACLGRIDHLLPGWPKRELEESLKLLRDVLAKDWDFHPEMITHTFAIDTKTGHPYPERTDKFIENNGFSVGKSTDFLADYIAYALRILKNAGLPCEGVTTPGGFGNRVRPQLAQGTLQACRDVYGTEIPHYFRHLYTGKESVAPRVEYASGLDGNDPKCVVSIVGCTGDWFGGWDGLEIGSVDKLITEDLKGGRMPEVIRRGNEPAIMVCHWPGIYFNGHEVGFKIFKEAVTRIHKAFDNVLWMKNSEIARYWAAKELTRIEKLPGAVTFQAPFASPLFTVEIETPPTAVPKVLKQVEKPLHLDAGMWTRSDKGVIVCFDLPKGPSRIDFA